MHLFGWVRSWDWCGGEGRGDGTFGMGCPAVSGRTSGGGARCGGGARTSSTKPAIACSPGASAGMVPCVQQVQGSVGDGNNYICQHCIGRHLLAIRHS